MPPNQAKPPESDAQAREIVRSVCSDAAKQLGAMAAQAMKDAGYENYTVRQGQQERAVARLARTEDLSHAINAIQEYWASVFAGYVTRQWQNNSRQYTARAQLSNARDIRNDYVGQHDVPCDYDPYEAVGEIRRLLLSFRLDEATARAKQAEIGRIIFSAPEMPEPPRPDGVTACLFLVDHSTVMPAAALAATTQALQELSRRLQENPAAAKQTRIGVTAYRREGTWNLIPFANGVEFDPPQLESNTGGGAGYPLSKVITRAVTMCAEQEASIVEAGEVARRSLIIRIAGPGGHDPQDAVVLPGIAGKLESPGPAYFVFAPPGTPAADGEPGQRYDAPACENLVGVGAWTADLLAAIAEMPRGTEAAPPNAAAYLRAQIQRF